MADESRSIECGLFVDTGAGALILPRAWKERLGDFLRSEPVELQLANGEVVRGESCWPVEIKIEGFRPVANEVVFMDAEEDDDIQEPLLGYVILEQAQARGGHAGPPPRTREVHRPEVSERKVGELVP